MRLAKDKDRNNSIRKNGIAGTGTQTKHAPAPNVFASILVLFTGGYCALGRTHLLIDMTFRARNKIEINNIDSNDIQRAQTSDGRHARHQHSVDNARVVLKGMARDKRQPIFQLTIQITRHRPTHQLHIDTNKQ